MQSKRLPYSVFRRLTLAEFVETVVVLPFSCVKEEICNESYKNYGEGNTLKFA